MKDLLHEQSIEALQAALQEGRTTSEKLVQTAMQRIDAYDKNGPRLNAMVCVSPEALETARNLDLERHQGTVRSPLHGIPIVVKDNFLTVDMPTTGGCKALQSLHVHQDAWQVQLLRKAGAIIIGKASMHELACGLTNASSVTGYTRNPYQPEHIPGGSSGGTAVAVAASFAVAGLGSDTGGSIRVPAACQNLYGLRPTWGLSGRSGMIPLCPTQDTAGPLARSVKDLAIMLDATAGCDPYDKATWRSALMRPQSFRKALQTGHIKGTRIGVMTSLFGSQSHEMEATRQLQSALKELESLGATLVLVDTPDLTAQLQAANITTFEFRHALAEFLEKVQAPVKSLSEILALNLHHPDVDEVLRFRNQDLHLDTPPYFQAVENRIAVQRTITGLMQSHDLDVIVYPTLRCAPVAIGQRQPGENCSLSPILGWPAISIPAGFVPSGLPVGLDLLAPPCHEQLLLNLAYDWEQSGARRVAPSLTPAIGS